MTTGTVELGPIPSEHFERWHEIRRQAFGTTAAFDPEAYGRIPPDRVLGAYVDGALSAATVVHPYLQTWNGAEIPCGGVSGVVVAPEARRHGLARRLLGAHLDEMRVRGEVTAALYPTTASLYRSLGFEVTGSYTTRSLPSHTVPTDVGHGVAWDRVDVDDPRISAVEGQATRVADGWLARDARSWSRLTRAWRSETSVNRFAFVARRDGVDVGAIVYHYVEPERPEFGVFYAIETDIVAATDPDGWRAAFAFVAMQSTTAAEIRTATPASVLLPVLSHPQRARTVESIPWMLRLVDVPAALAARPVNSAVSGTVDLEVTDSVIPANDGRWSLTFEEGRVEVNGGGAGRVRLSVRTLAQIFAGCDVASLARAGMIDGGTKDRDLLGAAYAGTSELQFFF